MSVQEYLSKAVVSGGSLLELSCSSQRRSIVSLSQHSHRKLVTALSYHIMYGESTRGLETSCRSLPPPASLCPLQTSHSASASLPLAWLPSFCSTSTERSVLSTYPHTHTHSHGCRACISLPLPLLSTSTVPVLMSWRKATCSWRK